MKFSHKNSKLGLIWIATSQATLIISNFFLLKILTSNLTIASYGLYTFFMSAALFLRQVIYDPISIILGKEIGSANQNGSKVSTDFQKSIYLTFGIGIALIFGGILLYLIGFTIDSRSNNTAMLAISFYLAANGAQGIYLNILNSISLRKKAATFSIVDAVLKLAFVFIAFKHFGNSIGIVLSAIALSTLTTTAIFFHNINQHHILYRAHKNRVISSCKKILILSTPIFIPTVLSALKSVADRWIITAFSGLEDLATFSVLQMLGYSPMIIAIGMAQTFLAPKIYSFNSTKNTKDPCELDRFLKKILLYSLTSSLLAAVIMFFVSDWIIKTTTSGKYYFYAKYLPLFVLSGGLAGTTNILSLITISIYSSGTAGKLISTTMLTNIAIMVLLTIPFKLEGVTLALFISSAVSLYFYYYQIRLKISGAHKNFCQ